MKKYRCSSQTALQNACKNINEEVASDNQTIKAAKTAAKNSSDSIAASIKNTGSKVCEISDKNSEEAKQLQSSISALRKSAKSFHRFRTESQRVNRH